MAHTSLPWIIGNILFPILISCLLIILFSPFVKRSYTRIILYTLDQFSILVNRHIGHKKRKLFSELRSVTSGFDLANEVKENGVFGSVTVVELGSGRGANFEYYPKGSQITCVEPVREYKEIIHENAARYPHVTLKSVVTGYAEDMSCIKSNSVDVVVSTHVMCSVGDIKTSLGEVKRILKKGGTFLYLEHVTAERKPWLKSFQVLINPFWKLLFCSLTTDVSCHVTDAGFTIETEEYFFVDVQSFPLWDTLMWPIVVRAHVMGVAVK